MLKQKAGTQKHNSDKRQGKSSQKIFTEAVVSTQAGSQEQKKQKSKGWVKNEVEKQKQIHMGNTNIRKNAGMLVFEEMRNWH